MPLLGLKPLGIHGITISPERIDEYADLAAGKVLDRIDPKRLAFVSHRILTTWVGGLSDDSVWMFAIAGQAGIAIDVNHLGFYTLPCLAKLCTTFAVARADDI